MDTVFGVKFGVASGGDLDVVVDVVLLRLATQADDEDVLGGRAAEAASTTCGGGTASDMM